ncbi:hypothetical protein ACTTAF_10270 [Rhodobacter capsulatus]|uniref:hypothetical protein n=1 Tax=Rhodobacter capsulatus TaxID=1061 RepID=UPI001038F662|nr:hypothetical protein [Rhodobacter capsulatus]
MTAPVSTTGHLQAGRGHLTEDERAEVLEIMDRRRMTVGDIMKEIGVNPLNASLGNALRQRWSLSEDLLALLRPWIAKNRRP